MPSWKTSTLSLMVLIYAISLPVLLIVLLLIARLAPDTFKLISEQKLAFLAVFGTYVVMGNGLLNAYLMKYNAEKTKWQSEGNSWLSAVWINNNIAPGERGPIVIPTSDNNLHDTRSLQDVW